MRCNTHEKYHNSDTVTPRELLEFGLDPAVLQNVDRDKKINNQIVVVSALKNGYSTEVINKLAEYFGIHAIINALSRHRDRVSDKLFETVKNQLKSSKHTT